MISWLISPLTLWARIVLWVLILAAICAASAIWLFPLIQSLLPQAEVTVGGP